MAVYETGSRAETAALGERLAKVLRSGSLVLFTGGLGAGKTAFCEGIARGLGCTDEVSSPTFAIVNVYRGPQPFAHFDMYRISTMEDLQATGFFDYLDDGAVCFLSFARSGRGLQTRRPFPLRLRKAVVIGDKLCSGHRFTRCQRSPAHAAGAAQAVGFGIQAGLARAVQRLVHQLRAVAQQPHRLPRAFHKPAQGSGGRALVRA